MRDVIRVPGLLPGLGGDVPIIGAPRGPNDWRVWPDIAPESAAQSHTAPDALSAVTIAIAGMMAHGMGPLQNDPDDYLARGQTGRVHRVRVERQGEALVIGELRACRFCGCSDDRACAGGCAWIAPDVCSACKGRAA